jgi:N-acetylglucosamine-6-sulfatase
MPCYSTSIIGNASLAWIQRHVRSNNNTHRHPFFSLISLKAPHLQDGPGFPMSIPAPWYENTSIPEQRAPRTPNYNISCPNHHWLVRSQLPLTQKQGEKIDQLYQSRLKTLLSVDDLVRDLVTTLDDDLGILKNTYILFNSDNGYRLGQFQMPVCKLHPYENDIRVPMMIRGPGIAAGGTTRSDIMGTHVDLMPTLLGLVNAAAAAAGDNSGNDDDSIIPKSKDGSNLASLLLLHNGDHDQVPTTSANNNRSLLIEYMSLGEVVRYQHLVDTYNHTFVALRILDTHRNWKYVEFRDSRVDWNATSPWLEREFFDLNRDFYELHNRIHHTSPLLLKALSAKLQRLLRTVKRLLVGKNKLVQIWR